MGRYTTPDFSSIALTTIDVQRDTLDGQPLEIPGTSAVLPGLRKLLQAFRGARLPIVHLVRLYKPDGSNVDLCRRALVEGGARILLPGSPGSQLAPELLPDPAVRVDHDLLLSGGIQALGPNEVILYKPRWGAFFGTPLEVHLRELGVTTLAFTGCNFPNCPRTSIYEASERDFRIILVRDAVSGLYPRGEEEMHDIGVSLLTAAEVAEAVLQGRRGYRGQSPLSGGSGRPPDSSFRWGGGRGSQSPAETGEGPGQQGMTRWTTASQLRNRGTGGRAPCRRVRGMSPRFFLPLGRGAG